MLRRLVRAHGAAAAFVEDPANREEVLAILSAPNRIGVAAEVIRRTLDGRLKVTPDGTVRDERALPDDRPQRRGAARPGAGGVALRADGALGAGAVVPTSCSKPPRRSSGPTSTTRRCPAEDQALADEPADGIGAFAGPAFDPNDIAGPSAGLDHQAIDRARLPDIVHCTKFPQLRPD